MSKFIKGFVGWYDRLPAGVQRAVYVIAVALSWQGVTYVGDHYADWNLPNAVQLAISFALPLVIGYLLPITQQIGIGKDKSTADVVVNAVEGAVK